MTDTPSITKQTPWPVGFFDFGKAEFTNVNYFNSGFVNRADGDWLLARRSIFDRLFHVGRNDIVAFKLDERTPSMGVKLKFPKRWEGEHFEDPRATYHHGRAWVSCTNFVWSDRKWSGAHQIMAAFNNNWEATLCFDPCYGKNGAGIGQDLGHEKNWLWFFHDDAPHLIYWADPHTVVRFNPDFRYKQEYVSENPFLWRHGEIRGGTPPVLVEGEYWTFFHSSTEWQPPFRQYHMGAYAFEAQPPFRITRMTREPVLSGSREDKWAKGKPIVVFPCGSVLRAGKWWITGGCNDLCCFWLELPHAELIKMTTPKPPILKRVVKALKLQSA